VSAWDSDGCDDSLVWTDMVFPLDASSVMRVVFLQRDCRLVWIRNNATHEESLVSLPVAAKGA
jgi:hypothetical protein